MADELAEIFLGEDIFLGREWAFLEGD